MASVHPGGRLLGRNQLRCSFVRCRTALARVLGYIQCPTVDFVWIKLCFSQFPLSPSLVLPMAVSKHSSILLSTSMVLSTTPNTIAAEGMWPSQDCLWHQALISFSISLLFLSYLHSVLLLVIHSGILCVIGFFEIECLGRGCGCVYWDCLIIRLVHLMLKSRS